MTHDDLDQRFRSAHCAIRRPSEALVPGTVQVTREMSSRRLHAWIAVTSLGLCALLCGALIGLVRWVG